MSKKTGPGWWARFSLSVKRWFGVNVVLCDTCKWNWRSCRNPDRPYATWCSEYEKRGE